MIGFSDGSQPKNHGVVGLGDVLLAEAKPDSPKCQGCGRCREAESVELWFLLKQLVICLGGPKNFLRVATSCMARWS